MADDLARTGLGNRARLDEDEGCRGDTKPLQQSQVEFAGIRHTLRILQLRDDDQRLVTLPFAGNGGNTTLPDAIVLFHDRFDVLRVVVEAANDEHVLAAPADIELAVVEEAHVAASQPGWPTLRVTGKPRLEDRRAQLRSSPIAAALAATPNPDLPDLPFARGAWGCRHVDDLHLRSAQRPAATDERRGVGDDGIGAHRMDYVLAKRSAVKGLNGPAVIRHRQGEFGQTIGRKEALGVETVRLEFPNEVTTDVGTHRLGGVHEEPKGTQVEMLQGRRRHLLRP